MTKIRRDYNDSLGKSINKIKKLIRTLISLILTYLILKILFSINLKDIENLLRITFNLDRGLQWFKVNYIWGKINFSYFGKNVLSKIETIIINESVEGAIFILSLLSLSFFIIFIVVYIIALLIAI